MSEPQKLVGHFFCDYENVLCKRESEFIYASYVKLPKYFRNGDVVEVTVRLLKREEKGKQ